MGGDAISAESAFFSPRRRRPLERGKNRRRRTDWTKGHFGAVSAVIRSAGSADRTRGGTRPARNFCTQRRFGRVSSYAYLAVFSRSDGTQTKRREVVGRRCRFDRVGPVFPPPESTPRADGTNIGGEVERRGMSAAPPLRCAPADLRARASKKRRWRTN